MPRPNYIALAVYAFPGIMSVLYILGITEAVALTRSTSVAFALFWSILLLIGSVLSFSGALISRMHPLRGLPLEGVGAVLAGLQLLAYAVSLIGPKSPWYTLVLTTCIAMGLIARAVQSLYEAREVRVITALIDGRRE